MKVFFEEIPIRTNQKYEVIDVTHEVEKVIQKSGIKDGLCLVYAPHATLSMVVNEGESRLVQDILKKLKEEYPAGAGWRHDEIDDNAHAHLASAFIGSSKIFPLRNGHIVRGTWQNILLIEADGPRMRRILVEVLGE